MNQSLITVRYAKALFEIAEEQNLVDTIKADMESIMVLAKESREFAQLLESPVIGTAQKETVLGEVLSNSLHEYSLKFVLLITQNKREKYLQDIARSFLDMYFKKQGIRQASITFPAEVSQEKIDQIKTHLEKQLDATIELTTKIDPAIMGGMILRIDDQQVDGSVSGKLRRIHTHLKQTEL